MTIAALALSSVSLVVASLALGWQVAQWLLSGGRARATLMHGLLGAGAAYTGAIKSGGSPHDLSSMRRQGLGQTEVLGVEVQNLGRLPVVVRRYSVALEGGKLALTPVGNAVGPTLPYRLEPGHSETWYVEMADVTALVQSTREVLSQNPRGVYMTVESGLGKSIRTKRTLRTSYFV